MKHYFSVLLAGFFLFAGCNRQRTVNPLIQYEFSGGAGKYNYAPSAIQDKYGIRYVFVCQNKEPFVIRDYVYLFKGIPTKNGYVWQPGTEIVAPSASGWDKIHICDPDVREFKTTYNGETYNWIMTYLGVDQWFNHNQIGLAVSKNIEGPYIKYDKNPLIASQDTTSWGVGQSTSIVKDSTTIQIYYTKHDPEAERKWFLCVREVKLDDLAHVVLGEEKVVPFLGPISYPALSDKNLYMVSEIRVSQNNEIPTWVGNVCRLTYKPITESLFIEEDGWIDIGRVTPEETGFPRNHNPGILTDTKGYMLNTDELVVYFTVAMTGDNWLWSYDLYSATFDIRSFEKKKKNKEVSI